MSGLSGFIGSPTRQLAYHVLATMNSFNLVTLSLSIAFLAFSCNAKPDADTIFQVLKPGEAQFVVTMDGDLFYPEESRFKGEITVMPNLLRLNLFDQFESNTIIALSESNLFAKRPITRPILLDNQSAGSVMIGKVRDKKQRTGDGFLMTEGTLTVDRVSDEKVVLRLTGKVANFNTMRDQRTWKRLEALLVYRKPTITVPTNAEKTLLY